MKYLFLFSFIFSVNLMFAQLSYELRIIDTQGLPMKNVSVTATNTSSKKKIIQTTDIKGVAKFTFTDAGSYQLTFLNVTNIPPITCEEGETAMSSRTYTYDPSGNPYEKPKMNRTKIQFKEVSAQSLKTSPGLCEFNIQLIDSKRNNIPNTEINIVDFKTNTIYKNKTDAKGFCTFYLTPKSEFEVDVDHLPSYSVIKTPENANVGRTEYIRYEKTLIAERTIGRDTVSQEEIKDTKGSSTHTLFEFSLINFEGEPLAEENVYVQAKNQTKVFVAKTNQNGKCKFMLPRGVEYLLSLKHERDMVLIDAKNTRGYSTVSSTRAYRGSAVIEVMLAERGRMIQSGGLITEFSQTPIKNISAPSNYKKTNTLGIEIDFGNSGLIGTSALVGSKLITQEGFHSPNLYCINAINGDFIWGVQLGESGISPIVVIGNILLINTYSCTLYAIDLNTGKLLWSKWLAGTIYSTPSSDGKNVFAVYNVGENPKNPSESYAISCFDLQTGKLKWNNWVDREVITCPVIYKNEVHIASTSGNYYIYDSESGKKIISSNQIHAVSTPSVNENSILITVSKNGLEQLVTLNKSNLQIVSKNAEKSYMNQLQHGSYKMMNFNGSHPVIYQNKIGLSIINKELIAVDLIKEQLLWKSTIDVNVNQLPIVQNETVFIYDNTGKLIKFNINTGQRSNLLGTTLEPEGQPLSNGKNSYFSSSEGIIISTKSLPFQWTQWNQNASHNLCF